jgi:hypothetical protein
MPVFLEFLLVAFALYVWESTLWLPLRGVALRRRRKGWKVLDPGEWFAVREVGVIPLFPLPPDAGMAPCQIPPLFVDGNGTFLIDLGKGVLVPIPSPQWKDLLRDAHHLRVGGMKVRISSDRCMEILHRSKVRGATPAEAVRKAWRIALSRTRSGREWRRWNMVSASLRWYGPILVLGFFAGLPLVYIHLGSERALYFALWLWFIMACTAGHLWWLGRRVYPDARSAFRMDALLCLVVPFHAMRASEIASVHAMGVTHPVGLMLSSGDLANPWLCRFIRGIVHPLPGNKEDAIYASALRPLMMPLLAHHGKSLADFDTPPDVLDDEGASRYCPRCHSLYQSTVSGCEDCRGLELRDLS